MVATSTLQPQVQNKSIALPFDSHETQLNPPQSPPPDTTSFLDEDTLVSPRTRIRDLTGSAEDKFYISDQRSSIAMT